MISVAEPYQTGKICSGTYKIPTYNVNSAWLGAFIGYNIGCKQFAPRNWFKMSFK